MTKDERINERDIMPRKKCFHHWRYDTKGPVRRYCCKCNRKEILTSKQSEALKKFLESMTYEGLHDGKKGL